MTRKRGQLARAARREARRIESRSTEAPRSAVNLKPVMRQGSQLLLKAETAQETYMKALRAAKRPVGNAARLSGQGFAESAERYLNDAIKSCYKSQEQLVTAISFLKRAANQ